MLNFAIKNGPKSDGTKVGAIKVDDHRPDGSEVRKLVAVQLLCGESDKILRL